MIADHAVIIDFVSLLLGLFVGFFAFRMGQGS